VTRKAVKHVHLSVHPPDRARHAGRADRHAPGGGARLRDLQARVDSPDQQAKLLGQARETPRQFVERESHYLWGRRYLLSVVEVDAKPAVKLDHRRITLSVRPGSTRVKREEVMHEWHRACCMRPCRPDPEKWERSWA
jgi:hypothetical protein